MNTIKTGTIIIKVSEDKMTAQAMITPPDKGERAIDLTDLKVAIRQSGVVFGVKDDFFLVKLIEDGSKYPVQSVVAEGTPPDRPSDATLTILWGGNSPVPSDTASSINLRELDTAKSVYSGQIIARKIKACSGNPGTTVTGEKKEGPAGKDVNIRTGANISVSADGCTFTALINGFPKNKDGIISIDPVFVVNGNVDYSIGNINFAGGLEIKGDVLDGFVIKADGDIHIRGNVQAADVIAGGDIKIDGGIITRLQGYITAGGGVKAKYIENSIVEAEKDVTVERAIINSFVRANGSIVCNSREGKIIGGDIMAREEIRAKTLGTDCETTTVLRAGYNYKTYLEITDLERGLEKIEQASLDIQKSIITLQRNGAASLYQIEPFKEKLSVLSRKKLELQQAISALKKSTPLNHDAAIRSEDFLHSGSVVQIGSHKERITNSLNHVTLTANEENGIKVSVYETRVEKTKYSSTASHSSESQKPLSTPSTAHSLDSSKSSPDGFKLPTVLVAEEGAYYRNFLKKILVNSKFDVIGEAEDGRQTIQQYMKLKPDVVTINMEIPSIDSLTAVRAIRKINPNARIIMLSSFSQKDKIKEAVKYGAKDIIMKPFIASKVVETMFRVLEDN